MCGIVDLLRITLLLMINLAFVMLIAGFSTQTKASHCAEKNGITPAELEKK